MDEEEQSKQYNVNTTRDVNVSYSQHNVYSRPPCLLGNVRIKVFSNLPSSYFDFIPIIRAAHERLLAWLFPLISPVFILRISPVWVVYFSWILF